MRPAFQKVLFIWPIACLIAASFVLPLAVPEISDVQGFVSKDLTDVPVFVWSAIGLALGVGVSFIRTKWPKQTLRYGARAMMAMGAWLLFGLLFAAFTGEGGYYERLRGSVVVGSWGVVIWTLLCMTPTALGVHSVMFRSPMSRGGTVLSFLFLALSGMIYAQAADVKVAHQDPFLSVGFILSVLGFLEGMNWRNRYRSLEFEERMSDLLLARQIGFTLIFLGIGAVVALVPFLIGVWPKGYYEPSTVLGKAFIGLLAIAPLAVLALVRNLMDR
jgi:hypothetical protein